MPTEQTQSALNPTPRKAPPPDTNVEIVVLTKSRDLLYKVLAAGKRGFRVRHATSVSKAEQLIRNESVGVLITNALPDALPRMLPRLKAWNPHLVVMAVGRRDSGDDDQLLRLQEAGEIYRFLLDPLSQGQLSLYIDAASRAYHGRMLGTVEQARHLRVDARESRTSRSNKTALPFSLAAIIFLTSASGLLLLGNNQDGGPESLATTLEIDADDRALARALVAAERARDERRFVDPPGDNAHFYYRQILAIRPNHRGAARGINDLVNQMFAQADIALRDDDFTEAREALGRARRIAPSHPRLGVIGSQVDILEQQSLLAQAVAAARLARYERADELLAAAASARPGESDLVRQTRGEIATIRVANDAAIESATAGFEAAMSADELLPPWEDNARDLLTELIALNAPSTVTGEFRARLQGELEARIDQHLDDGQFDEAERVILDLADLANTTLAKVRVEEFQVALAQSRNDDLEGERLRDLAIARLQAGQLLRPVDDSALLYLQALSRVSNPPEALANLWREFEEALVARATQAVANGQLRTAERLLEVADGLANHSAGVDAAYETYSQALENERRLAQAEAEVPSP